MQNSSAAAPMQSPLPVVNVPASTENVIDPTSDTLQASPEANLTVGRNLKIGLFHLGSGMADVIATGIWNRIMISDLGFAATPIGLLVALRYFLAPLGLWAGKMSDRHALFGYRRLFWIWLGRAMMAVSVAALGFATADLVRAAAEGGRGSADALHWLLIVVSLVLFSLGNALSGSTFLALVYDRSGEHQRGRAVGIVWTFLLLGFTVGGILFGVLLPGARPEAEAAATTLAPAYSADTLLTLFLVAAGALAALWFFSLLGEERRTTGRAAVLAAQGENDTSIVRDLKLAWRSRTMRAFFWFLALSMLFSFSQDLILEPFGAEAFGMEARTTTRFTAYWGSMAILATIIFLFLGRRFKSLTNTRMSNIGVIALVITFGIFTVSAFGNIRPLVTVGLVTLGIGLGIWNVGTLGLMTEMSPVGRAGTFLGFWTLVVTLARGIGVSGGGIVRDLMVGLVDNPATPAIENAGVVYGVAFALAGVGLVVSLVMLRQARTEQFSAEYTGSYAAEFSPAQAAIANGDAVAAVIPTTDKRPDPERVFAGSMD